MQGELQRASVDLAKTDPAPYYISYTLYDQSQIVLAGAYGSLLTNSANHRRQVDVTTRVGSPALDNTHGQSRGSGMMSGSIPFGSDPDAIGRVLWELTDRGYKRASPAFLNVKTNTAVRAAEEDKSPDFSKEAAVVHTGEEVKLSDLDRTAWEGEIRRVSAIFRKYPNVYFASVILQEQNAKERMVTSEGTAIATPSASTRLIMEAQTRADDGMDLLRVETFQAPSAKSLPDEAELTAKAEKMATDLDALRKAPVAEPYDGPALLSGRAAAVFFHEVLGHRLEGHRQRDEDEGQTFTKKVGQEVIPKFLSIVDDPTIREVNGTKLAGTYEFDSEGVPAQRVELITHGVLKSFLTSRMPIKGFEHSNGHGRNQPGLMPTGRQGNLMVTSSQTVPEKDMRQKLIDEAKKTKPYGLFRRHSRRLHAHHAPLPQAFRFFRSSYQGLADGRPTNWSRVDIVGTPLAASLASHHRRSEHVFNGVCGAGGNVPVSAVAPQCSSPKWKCKAPTDTTVRRSCLRPASKACLKTAAQTAPGEAVNITRRALLTLWH